MRNGGKEGKEKGGRRKEGKGLDKREVFDNVEGGDKSPSKGKGRVHNRIRIWGI